MLAYSPSQSSSADDEVRSNGTASVAEGAHDAGRSALLPSSADPEALLRLGWYLYLVTKEILEFRSTNAAFMRCLNLILGSLGALIWNSSSRSASANTDEDDQLQQKELVTANGGERDVGITAGAASSASGMGEGECSGGRGGAKGGYGSEANLLAALSASGRCPASEVRAMSARVVEVIETLLFEGIVVSHTSTSSSQTPLGASSNPGKKVDDTSRAQAVAGVFHPVVAADNAARLDACYWARISQRTVGGFGGRGVLDETFVLTPSLRCGERTLLRPTACRAVFSVRIPPHRWLLSPKACKFWAYIPSPFPATFPPFRSQRYGWHSRLQQVSYPSGNSNAERVAR